MLNYDSYMYRYPSRRSLVFGRRGMVATSNPLASEVGLEVLRNGGNAIDAAVAAATTLSVVEPSGNGIGGDSFAQIYFNGELYGMNASGRSPQEMTMEKFEGKTQIPDYGIQPVTVPGTVSGWQALNERFGTKSLPELMQYAIDYAEKGWPVPVTVAELAHDYHNRYTNLLEEHPEVQTWFDMFSPDGKPLEAGQVFKSQDLADTLREIAETDGESFYRGAIADDIDKFSREYGGFIRKSDLEKHKVEWVDPISVNYRGYDIWELPPNSNGLVALMALNNLEQMTLNEGKDSVDTVHKQIEATKLAFVDGLKHISDPDFTKFDFNGILTEEHAKKRVSELGDMSEVYKPSSMESKVSGTVYFTIVDEEGNMVSMVQTCYTGFGSGAVVPNRGIQLHNRGKDFRLDPEHPNALEPGKRTFHTIIPGFISKDGEPIGTFGCMGGTLQPQAHVQLISGLIDFGLNPQEALDAPRWFWQHTNQVQFEASFDNAIVQALERKGHKTTSLVSNITLGRGQIILFDKENQVLIGGTEPRTDSHISTW